jgi:hypothetical protein
MNLCTSPRPQPGPRPKRHRLPCIVPRGTTTPTNGEADISIIGSPLGDRHAKRSVHRPWTKPPAYPFVISSCQRAPGTKTPRPAHVWRVTIRLPRMTGAPSGARSPSDLGQRAGPCKRKKPAGTKNPRTAAAAGRATADPARHDAAPPRSRGPMHRRRAALLPLAAGGAGPGEDALAVARAGGARRVRARPRGGGVRAGARGRRFRHRVRALRRRIRRASPARARAPDAAGRPGGLQARLGSHVAPGALTPGVSRSAPRATTPLRRGGRCGSMAPAAASG